MKYLLQSVRSRGDYVLLSSSKEKLASLTFPKWYNSNAICSLGVQEYTIKPANMLGTHYNLLQSGIKKGSIKLNWKHRMVFSINVGSLSGQSFELMSKGFFQYHFHLLRENGELAMRLKPTHDYKTWIYNYELLPQEPFMDEGPNEFFLLSILCGYATQKLINNGAA